MQADQRTAVERWFRRRGLPLFIEGRSAEEDIWTRALPFLVVVFLFQALNAVNLEADWPVWANVLALIGGFVMLVGIWMIVNLARGHPALGLPRRVGPVELGIFVLVPPVLPILFGGQIGSAGATVAVNLVLLGVVFVVVDLGVVSMTRWGLWQLGRQFGDVLAMVVRALPLLLLFVTFLFINSEVWQVTSRLPWWMLAIIGGLFFLIGALFASLRVPRQIRELSEPVGTDRARGLLADTPTPVTGSSVAFDDRRPLSRRQWGNVGLVILVSEGVQVLLVTVIIFAFFSLFGFLAIGVDVVEGWTVAEADVIWTLTVGDHDLVLTEQLLKVAAFLASFSGLYFTVSILTDATYREEFLDEIVDEVRRSLLVRDEYLRALAD